METVWDGPRLYSWAGFNSWTCHCIPHRSGVQDRFPGAGFQLSPVSQSCPNSFPPVDYSTPRLPCPSRPELAQTHVHPGGDAIQPSHPMPSPSLPAFNLSQHQGLSSESVLRIRWPKYWSFSISPSNDYSGLLFFGID